MSDQGPAAKRVDDYFLVDVTTEGIKSFIEGNRALTSVIYRQCVTSRVWCDAKNDFLMTNK